jgi:GNAT superfamily N-acetyltransferase
MPTFPLDLDGYTDLPPGKLANVVTNLEMLARPAPRPEPSDAARYSLERLNGRDVARYLAIYATLGERWMWFSRLEMAREKLVALLDDPSVEAFALVADGQDSGLLELDFREAQTCELAFFGVYERLIGSGAARWTMNRAIEAAWREPVRRFWVHTCTFDHPRAVDFYQRSGFTPFKLSIEVADDPRLNGKMRREAAPHVPLIGS